MPLGTEMQRTPWQQGEAQHHPANLPQTNTYPAEREGRRKAAARSQAESRSAQTRPCFLRVPRKRKREILISVTSARFLSLRTVLPARRFNAGTDSPRSSYGTWAASRGPAGTSAPCSARIPPAFPEPGGQRRGRDAATSGSGLPAKAAAPTPPAPWPPPGPCGAASPSRRY